LSGVHIDACGGAHEISRWLRGVNQEKAIRDFRCLDPDFAVEHAQPPRGRGRVVVARDDVSGKLLGLRGNGA
jgi:hypothetical protein